MINDRVWAWVAGANTIVTGKSLLDTQWIWINTDRQVAIIP